MSRNAGRHVLLPEGAGMPSHAPPRRLRWTVAFAFAAFGCVGTASQDRPSTSPGTAGSSPTGAGTAGAGGPGTAGTTGTGAAGTTGTGVGGTGASVPTDIGFSPAARLN